MRKLFATMCITAMLAAICGCSGETKTTPPTTTTTPPADAPADPHK